MPLLFIKDIDADTRLGLWKIADELQIDEVCPLTVCEEIRQKCGRRQTETAAVYALLAATTGCKDTIIRHNEDGKPMIDGLFISISHTVGYASIIVSKTRNVAVDIEYRNNRVFRIAEKFLTAKEFDAVEASLSNQNREIQTKMLLCWCAKETVYKYFSEEKLAFEDMETDIHEPQSDLNTLKKEGEFLCINLPQSIKKTIKYMQNDDFVLTYTL